MCRRSVVVLLSLLMAFLPLAGCGGNNPASPSPSGKGAVLRGVVVGEGASASSGDVSAKSTSAGGTKVSVQENTAITTTVRSNGTFELDNIPTGNFTLVFSNGTTVLGTVRVRGVPDDGQVVIIVQITIITVIVINIEINGVPVPPGDDDDDGGDHDDEDDD
jgi:hypothetical protein